jgi:hypothetical protein
VIRLIAAFGLLALLAVPAAAHKESDAYLDLDLAGDPATGTLDLHVADLDAALGLDADGDGQIRKGEVRAALPRIEAYLGERLAFRSGDASCTAAYGPAGFATRTDGPYLSLPLSLGCPRAGPLSIAYGLFFDIDSRHRGRLVAADGAETWAVVFDPGRTAAAVGAEPQGLAAMVGEFVWQGILHILEGTDHVLFVLTLLLAAAGAPRVHDVLRQILFVVTAFTLAHSVTLALASFGILRPDPVMVEAAIAATVVLAALNVIWPVLRRELWGMALVFGLIHGFGFANVLAELDLPQSGFAVALFAFNLGVEIGQLMIVAVALPLILLARRAPETRRVAVTAGAAAIAVVAALWFSDRAFGTAIGIL